MEGSTIDVQKLESATPGHEGFYARCLILQKTAEHETYRYKSLLILMLAPFEILQIAIRMQLTYFYHVKVKTETYWVHAQIRILS